MGIVSKLPFQIKFLCPHRKEKKCTAFSMNLSYIYDEEIVTIEIEENEEVFVFFQSEDENARFYLEAFDVIPEGYGIVADEKGKLYKKPSKDIFPLYRNNNMFDALCVDKFIMKIVCNRIEYYGMLSVRPKQLEDNEWNQMRNELEQEVKNLARQTLKKKFIDMGIEQLTKEEWIYLENLYQHRQWLLAVLQDIIEKPKYRIVTNYVKTKNTFRKKTDRKTVQYQIQKGKNDTRLLPIKEISYDIAENRFLKMVMHQCKKVLKSALKKIKCLVEKKISFIDSEQLLEYYNGAVSVYKSIEVLEIQKWFKKIKDFSNGKLSNAFFLDDRYGYIYRMYLNVNKVNEAEINLLSFTFAWKPSSLLYEMWCYIKLCREFEKKWTCHRETLDRCFIIENGISGLKEGCFVEYRKEDIRIKIFYNPKLPRSSAESDPYDQPYYMLNAHVQPDIVIHMFGGEEEIYMGSLVLECKYRKVNSFWNSVTISSREQITAYWTGSKSKYYMKMLGNLIDVRPVKRVYVLMPEKVVEERYEGEILFMSMHPGEELWIEKLYQEIEKSIEECNQLRKQIELFM